MLVFILLIVTLSSILALDIEIGDGTSFESNIPINGLYEYGWSTFIIEAELIGVAEEFNQLKFHPSSNPTNYTFTNQKVYFKETTATEVTLSYPAPEANGFTLVYEGNVTFDGNSWQGVILDTPFDYNGTSNLQILWENHSGTYDSSYPFYYVTNVEHAVAAFKRQDNSFPAIDGEIANYFPNIRLSYTAENEPTVATYVAPTNNATEIPIDVTIEWEFGENTTDIDLYLSNVRNDVVTMDAAALVVDRQNVTSYQPDDLIALTDYYWRVVSHNSTNDLAAIGPMWKFSTAVGAGVVTVSLGDRIESNNTYPWGFNFKNSVAETIYLADEIGVEGLLTQISYYNTFASNISDTPINVWIGETSEPDLTDYIPASQLTPVFSGLMNFPAGQNTITIALDTPYEYTGDNLVILTERPLDTIRYSWDDQFYHTPTDLANRTLFWISNAAELNIETPAMNPLRRTNRPDITFYFAAGGTGSVTGTVTHGTTALAGANISINHTDYHTTSLADGSFIFSDIITGSDYTLTASLQGYHNSTATFDVVANQETVVNIEMTPLTTVEVSGQIVTDDTGAGVQSHVILRGYEIYETDTDADGFFTIEGVFNNKTYTGIAIPEGYQSVIFPVVVAEGDLELGTISVAEILYPAREVSVEIVENNAEVSWSEPDNTGAGEWLTKGADENDDGVGTGNAATIYVSHKYTEAELTEYQGMFINSIKFFAREALATYTLKVWGGENGAIELYSQDVTDFVNNSWNEYILDSPVAIPLTGTIYIGYYVDTPAGHPAGCDAGPSVVGGDMIKIGEQPRWSALSEMSTIDANWNIKAYLTWTGDEQAASPNRVVMKSSEPKTSDNQSNVQVVRGNLEPITNVTNYTRLFQGYNIYRFLTEDETELANWSLIAEGITDLTHSDADWSTLDTGFYKYAVRAVYTNDAEAEPAISNFVENSPTKNVTINVESNLGNAIAEANILLRSQLLNPNGEYTQYQSLTDESGTAIIVVNVGMYNLTVTAPGFETYTGEVDATADVTVNVTLDEIALPPTAVVAEQEGTNALITWNEPSGDGSGEWITKGGEENSDGIGTGGAAIIDVAQMFTQAELVDYQGMYINNIKFIPREPGATYTVKVWGGADGNTELYSQAVPQIDVEVWNEVPLNSSVAIPATGPVYFGYSADTPTGHPCACDAGPAVPGGDLIKLNNQPDWDSIADMGLDYNWNLQAYLSWSRGGQVASEEGRIVIQKHNPNANDGIQLVRGNLDPIVNPSVIQTRALEGYKVWRFLATDQGNENNWTSLTPTMIDDLTYTDTSWNELTSGAYRFAVKAIYTNDNPSPAAFSNELLKDMYGTVDGTVMNESNAPISGATIHFMGGTATTDGSGYFIFTNVLAGEYEITATAASYVSSTQNITVVGTQVTTVDFTLAESDILFSDSFETYPDFALQAAPWVLVDVDGNGTYGFTGINFPGTGEPMAYIVFNPSMTVPPLDGEANAPHTGSKYMATFAANPAPNNDWMITQEFTLGDTGSFSFWGKTVMADYGLERFNVLVSDGSINPNDFASISGPTYVEAPVAWTQFTYSLDAYANQTIRVAIQCVSNDAFIFMVDDVEVDAPGGTDNESNDVILVSALEGNYPNPFNPETTIAFSTKESGQVSLDIYNIKGQKVRTLINDHRDAGSHKIVWNGKDDNGKSVASGVFFYRMKSGKYSSTKKMILMK